MKRVRMGMVVVMLYLIATVACVASEAVKGMSGKEGMQKLLEGNLRYVSGKVSHPDQTVERRAEIAKGQHPFAIIVCCSDSRVPPEILFDQGFGDLFVVRLAGNVLNDAALGSIEYAVEHLGSKCIVVLGHERCGAVDATLKGGEAPGHIGALVKAIQPAVDSVKGKPGDALDNAVRANIQRGVQQLKSTAPILEEQVKKGELEIFGARYDLDEGKVDVLP